MGPPDRERFTDPQSRGDQEDTKLRRPTLNRLLIGTEPLVKASALVRGQRFGLVEIRATSRHGIGDQGVVAASKGAYA